MLVTEHVEVALRFLAQADREYDVGDVLQASEKLWGAAAHVVIAEMQRRDIKTSGHRAMVLAIAEIADDVNDADLEDEFAAAGALHANFYHGFMGGSEFEKNRMIVRGFVDRMLELGD